MIFFAVRALDMLKPFAVMAAGFALLYLVFCRVPLVSDHQNPIFMKEAFLW